jgi:hypothetical protein
LLSRKIGGRKIIEVTSILLYIVSELNLLYRKENSRKMTNKYKKSVVVLLVALFALSLLMMPNQVSAKPKKIDVYAGQSTIQEAINAANPGDKIIVHEGTYTESVDVYKDLTLIGEDATIAVPPGLDGFGIRADATVSGFKIQPDANYDPSTFFRAGIMFHGTYASGAAAIDNEILPGFDYPAIWFHDPDGIGSSGVKIQNNIIHASITAISIEVGSDISVKGNVIESGLDEYVPGADGFGIWSASDRSVSGIEIADNVIHSRTGNAIFIYPALGASDVTIRNNILTADSIGIYVEAIYIGNIEGCVISGNEITSGYGGNGISAGGISDSVIANNVIQNSFSVGRGMDIFSSGQGNSENVVVRNNRISTVDIGIHFSPGVANSVVKHNEVYINNVLRAASYGIVFNTVVNCEASNNYVCGGGWGMWAMWSEGLTIKNNDFEPNEFGGICGIALSDVTNSEISRNKVNGDIYIGIALDQGSNTNNVIRNKIDITGEFGMFGINLASDTSANYVWKNKISGAAIDIQDDSGLNIVVP